MDLEEQQALEFARVLQRAVHPDVVKALRVRATKGSTPLARRAALLALEGRDPAVWWEPVTRAFRKDDVPAVRREAADILARALANPELGDLHVALRETLVRGLVDISG